MNVDSWFWFACIAAAINGCIFGLIARSSLLPGRLRPETGGIVRRVRRLGGNQGVAWFATATVFIAIALLFLMPAWHRNQPDLGRMMVSCFALMVMVTARPQLMIRIAESLVRGLSRIE